VREKAYVEAARCIGALNLRIIFKYILPNVSASIIVVTTFGVGQAIISEAGLSFLGLGVPLAIPSWGGMLADGRSFIATHWWLALFPGLTIFVVVLAINVLGDNLRDVLDPYVTHNRPK
jgi:peptide/nickel transport system permease protein